MKANAAPGLFTRLAGIILLAVFGAGQLPVLPLLAAAVAAMDGGHEVELTGGRDAVRLVLHHQPGTAHDPTTRASGHHHRGLMRLIAGEDTGQPHPDHELLFRSAGSLAKEAETPALLALCATPADPIENAGAVALCRGHKEAHGCTLHYWWPPSPAECAWGCVVLLV